MSIAKLFFDGACRGNGGRRPRASYGYAIEKDGVVMHRHGARLGVHTNNQAEYAALLAGLLAARDLGLRHLVCYGDSLLVVNQMNGTMQVHNPELRAWRDRVAAAAQRMVYVRYRWIPRHHNALADSLANAALDRRAE